MAQKSGELALTNDPASNGWFDYYYLIRWDSHF